MVNFFITKNVTIGGKLLRVVFSRTFVVQVWHKFGCADCHIVSAGKGSIPRRALICYAPAVPLSRSLNTVAFVGN